MYYLWEGVLLSDECEHLKSLLKDKQFQPAKIGLFDSAVLNPEVRKTSVMFIDEQLMINRTVCSFVDEANKLFFKYQLEGFESIQFAKYDVGDFYEWHQDTAQENKDIIRKLTAVVQLSDENDYKGGDFEFFNGKNEPIKPNFKKQGSVIVFDSRDWHRMTTITEGERYSLACWCLGKKFV